MVALTGPWNPGVGQRVEHICLCSMLLPGERDSVCDCLALLFVMLMCPPHMLPNPQGQHDLTMMFTRHRATAEELCVLATMSEAATGHATEDQSSGPCHWLGTSVVFIALILVTAFVVPLPPHGSSSHFSTRLVSQKRHPFLRCI